MVGEVPKRCMAAASPIITMLCYMLCGDSPEKFSLASVVPEPCMAAVSPVISLLCYMLCGDLPEKFS